MSLDADEVDDVICPACGKPLTIGVSLRVEQLANRDVVKAGEMVQPFKYVLPLPEIFAELLHIKADVPLKTASVANAYAKAISFFGSEFDILHHMPVEDIGRYNYKLSVAIERLRNNQKHFTAGYDGIYGKLRFFDEGELDEKRKQLALF